MFPFLWIPIIKIVLPTFDWGSFFGALIGVLGAFGAAYYSYHLQQRPAIERKKVELKLRMSRALSKAYYEIDKTTNTNLQKVFEAQQHWLLDPLVELLGLSAEADQEIFQTLNMLYLGIHAITSRVPMERIKNPQYMGTDASLTEGNSVKDQILHKINETAKSLGLLETWK